LSSCSFAKKLKDGQTRINNFPKSIFKDFQVHSLTFSSHPLQSTQKKNNIQISSRDSLYALHQILAVIMLGFYFLIFFSFVVPP
jgi:CRISPR/Cas system CSM-associated protein Csm4 (group 5 of RAMP superfamily)